MLRPRMLAALVVAGAGLATAIWLPTRQDTASAADRTDTAVEEFAFSDDFDAPEGAPLDALRWHLQAGPSQAGGAGRLRDTARGAVQDGHGHLIVSVPASAQAAPSRRCHDRGCRGRQEQADSSVQLSTEGLFSSQYGRLETRMRLPREVAMRAKLALVADNPDTSDSDDAAPAEISAVETDGDTLNTVHAGLRGPQHTGDDAILGTRTDADGFWHDFHTFAVDWTPDQIVWSIDDVDFLHATPRTIEGAPWVYEQPAHLVLELTAPADLQADAQDADSDGTDSDSDREPGSNRVVTVDFVRMTAFDDQQPGDEQPTPPTTAPTTPAPTTPAPTTPAPTPTTPAPTTPAPTAKPWAPFTNYPAGQLVTYKAKTYQVLQAHTSLPAWQPPNVPALFKLQ